MMPVPGDGVTPLAAAFPAVESARGWIVFAGVSIVIVFAQGTVFAGLGIVLFAMADTFRWTAAQAGGGFTAMVIACCVAALWPVVLIRRIGARWTVVAGCLVLAVGFLLASRTQGLLALTVSMAFAGAGFSLVANTPATYLIAGWSGARAPRMIGLYLMISGFGSAAGPPVAQVMISEPGGWPFYWRMMAAVALALAGGLAWALREPPRAASPAAPVNGVSRYRDIVAAAPFMIMATAMVATQICLLTVLSITPAHFATRGWSVAFAAQILGVQGLMGALATGASGFLTRFAPPKRMLVGALLLEAIGMTLLAIAREPWAIYAFALSFGIGSCVTTLAVTVLLVRHFGDLGGTFGLGMIWTLSGAASVGPLFAGLSADALGGFAPALIALGAAMVPIALAVVLMRPEPAA